MNERAQTTNNESRQFNFRPVDIIENPTLDEIKAKINDRKPFMIRGYDIGPCIQKWTPEYMSEKMDKLPVKIHVSPHPKLDFISKNFLYKALPFDEFISRVTKSGNDNFFFNRNEVYYLRSIGPDPRGKKVADLTSDFPNLAGDLKIPKVFDDADFFSAILRISSAGVQIWTHYDVMDNILIQIKGRKNVILWPPSEVENLYLLGDKSRIINVDKPDDENYPKFSQAIRYECILEQGDLIFIPALWFHNTKAIESSFAVNVFWKNLPHELYDKNDSYGNKDYLIASKALMSIENSVKSLDVLPHEYKQFYIKRMINQLEEKLQNFDQITNSKD